MKKITVALAFALTTTIGFASTTLAKPSTPTKGVAQFSIASGQIYCGGHRTDVCIMNKSSQPIYYNIPTLGDSGPIYPSDWIDAYDSDYYPSLYVRILNANGDQIFSQSVPDHAIIKVTPDSLAKGKSAKLVARVIS